MRTASQVSTPSQPTAFDDGAEEAPTPPLPTPPLAFCPESTMPNDEDDDEDELLTSHVDANEDEAVTAAAEEQAASAHQRGRSVASKRGATSPRPSESPRRSAYTSATKKRRGESCSAPRLTAETCPASTPTASALETDTQVSVLAIASGDLHQSAYSANDGQIFANGATGWQAANSGVEAHAAGRGFTNDAASMVGIDAAVSCTLAVNADTQLAAALTGESPTRRVEVKAPPYGQPIPAANNEETSSRVVSSLFATASGKPVTISREKLAEASARMAESHATANSGLNSVSDVASARPSAPLAPLGKRRFAAPLARQAPAAASLAPPNSHTNNTTSPQKGPPPLAHEEDGKVVSSLFTSAGGKPVLIARKSLREAEQKINGDVSDKENTPIGASSKTLLSGGAPSDSIVSSLFTSASGKPVTISKKSLEAAHQKLSNASNFEPDQPIPSDPTPAVPPGDTGDKIASGLFTSASGKPVMISKKGLEEAKSRMATNNEGKPSEASASDRVELSLFSTAGGKKVSVSASSMKKAQSIVEAEPSLFATGDGRPIKLTPEQLRNGQDILARLSQRNDDEDGDSADVETNKAPKRGRSGKRCRSESRENEDNSEDNASPSALRGAGSDESVAGGETAPDPSVAPVQAQQRPFSAPKIGGIAAQPPPRQSGVMRGLLTGVGGNIAGGLKGGRRAFVPPTVRTVLPSAGGNAIGGGTTAPPARNINYGNQPAHSPLAAASTTATKTSIPAPAASPAGGRRLVPLEYAVPTGTNSGASDELSAHTALPAREGISFAEAAEFEFPAMTVRCPITRSLLFGVPTAAEPRSSLLLSGTDDLFVSPVNYQRALVSLGADVRGCSTEWVRNALTHSCWMAYNMPHQHTPPTVALASAETMALDYAGDSPLRRPYSPEHALAFLVSRYNEEYVSGNRSVLKKMCEKDLPTTPRMALWVVSSPHGHSGAAVGGSHRVSASPHSSTSHFAHGRNNANTTSPARRTISPAKNMPLSPSSAPHKQSHPCSSHPIAIAAAAARNFVPAMAGSVLGGSGTNDNKIIVSDGCYAVTAVADAPMMSMVREGLLPAGSLMEVWGATSQSDAAGTPLEVGLNATVLGLNFNGIRVLDPFTAFTRNEGGGGYDEAKLGIVDGYIPSVGLLNISPTDFPIVPVRRVHPQGGAVPSIVGVVTRVLPPHFQEREIHNGDMGTSSGTGGGRRSGRFSEGAARAPRVVRNKAAEEKRNDAVLRSMQRETERMLESATAEGIRKRERSGLRVYAEEHGDNNEAPLSIRDREEIVQCVQTKYARDVNIVVTVIVEEASGNVAVIQQWMEGTASTYAAMEGNVPKEGSRIQLYNLHPSRSGRPMPPFHGKLLFARPTFNFLAVPSAQTERAEHQGTCSDTDQQLFAFARRTYTSLDTFEGSITNTMVDVCCFVIDVVKTVPLQVPPPSSEDGDATAAAERVFHHNNSIPAGTEITTIVFCTTSGSMYGSLEVLSSPHLEISVSSPQQGSVVVLQNIIYKCFDATSGEANVVRFSANEYTQIVQNTTNPQLAETIRDMDVVSRQIPSVQSTISNGQRILASAASAAVAAGGGHPCTSFLVRPPSFHAAPHSSALSPASISIHCESISPQAPAPSGPLLATHPVDYAVCTGASLQQGKRGLGSLASALAKADSHAVCATPVGASGMPANNPLTSALLGSSSLTDLRPADDTCNAQAGPSPASPCDSSRISRGLFDETVPSSHSGPSDNAGSPVVISNNVNAASTKTVVMSSGPKRTMLFPRGSPPALELPPDQVNTESASTLESRKYAPPPPLVENDRVSPVKKAASNATTPTESPVSRANTIALGRISAAVAMAFPQMGKEDTEEGVDVMSSDVQSGNEDIPKSDSKQSNHAPAHSHFPTVAGQQRHQFGNFIPSTFVLRVRCGEVATIDHPLTDFTSGSFRARFRAPQPLCATVENASSSIKSPKSAEDVSLVPFFSIDRDTVMRNGLDVSLIANFTNGFTLVKTAVYGMDAICSLFSEMVGPASKLSSSAAVTEEWYQLSIARASILQSFMSEEERWRAILLQSAVVSSDDLGLCVTEEDMSAHGATDNAAGQTMVIDFPALGTLKRWNQAAFTDPHRGVLWWHHEEWTAVQHALFRSFSDRLVKVTVADRDQNEPCATYPLVACFPIKEMCNVTSLI